MTALQKKEISNFAEQCSGYNGIESTTYFAI